MRTFILILLLISNLCFSQKKKTVKKLGVKSVATKDIVGKNIFDDSKITYNVNGKVYEEIKYDPQGKLKSTVRYKYDKNNNEIMETTFNDQNKIIEIRKSKFNSVDQKTEEVVMNQDIRQRKKFIYVYNSQGLRLERKSFDSLNNLTAVKKYIYTFK